MDSQDRMPSAARSRPVRRRRRDRHGRGLRGPLLPPAAPARRTPGERFEDLVADAVDRLAPRVGPAVEQTRFRTAMIPDRLDQRISALQTWGSGSVDDPLGDSTRDPDGTPVITLYRRPLEARAGGAGTSPDHGLLAELVYATLVEQWAALTGVDPAAIDPDQQD
ncbi:metallopeptidase family protein [Micrococcus terreus]|uniref:metallopeptidase family protein n=1 Tax=Micrococcus terreus TaxID=574650 RepID=UPI00301B5074